MGMPQDVAEAKRMERTATDYSTLPDRRQVTSG